MILTTKNILESFFYIFYECSVSFNVGIVHSNYMIKIFLTMQNVIRMKDDLKENLKSDSLIFRFWKTNSTFSYWWGNSLTTTETHLNELKKIYGISFPAYELDGSPNTIKHTSTLYDIILWHCNWHRWHLCLCLLLTLLNSLLFLNKQIR